MGNNPRGTTQVPVKKVWDDQDNPDDGNNGNPGDTGTTGTTGAKTDDTNAPVLYLFLIVLSGAAIVTLLSCRRLIQK